VNALGVTPSAIVAGIAAWAFTFLLHSGLAVAGAALLERRLRRPADRDALWKAALVAGLITATVQVGLGWRPFGELLALPVAAGGATETRPALPAEMDSMAAHRDTSAAVAVRHVQAPLAGRPAAQPAAWWRGIARLDVRRILTAALPVLLACWAATSALLLVRLLVSHLALRRRLADRSPVLAPELRRMLASLAEEAGLRREVELSATTGSATPLVFGGGEICLPVRFVTELPPAAQRAALAHEVAHLRRHDPHWQLAAAALTALLPFQPLLRLARRRLRREAELLCDDWAAGRADALDLARCLLAVGEWQRERPGLVAHGVLAMAEDGAGLSGRVERLLDASAPRGGRPGLAAVLIAAALTLAVAVMPGVAAGRVVSHTESSAMRRSDRHAPTSHQGGTLPASALDGLGAAVADLGTAVVDLGDERDLDLAPEALEDAVRQLAEQREAYADAVAAARSEHAATEAALVAGSTRALQLLRPALQQSLQRNLVAVIPADHGSDGGAGAARGGTSGRDGWEEEGSGDGGLVDRPRSALGRAAQDGDTAKIVRLLDSGTPVDLTPRGDATPLMIAAEAGHLGVVELLLDRGADVNARVPYDGTPLIAAARGGSEPVVVALLDAGADPNLGIAYDESPLYHAVARGDVVIAERLVEAGADPDLRPPGAESPLALARARGRGRLLDLLRDHSDGWSPDRQRDEL
jgi:beta-lactamase regulating signal transducer with metallopeptidase domain